MGLDEGAGIVIEGTPRDVPTRIVPFDELAGAACRILESARG